MVQDEQDEYLLDRGSYLSGLAEDYYYATHPDKRKEPMSDTEVKRIIQEYRSLTSTQNQKASTTSEKRKQ